MKLQSYTRVLLALFVVILVIIYIGGRLEKKEAILYDYNVEERITQLGITLKEPGVPVANYVNAVRSGRLVRPVQGLRQRGMQRLRHER